MTAQEDGLTALQRQADRGPVVQRLANLRAMADGGAIQRADLEDEELIQGKFAPGGDVAQRQVDEEEPLQSKAVRPGGLPAPLQHAMQMMSGVSLGDVQVHHNSAAPGQVGAHAYAQGNNIHLAAGQERHLPHEAWHVVQQKQGRVQPTMALGDVPVNDSPSLEAEADQMGERASRGVF